MRAAARSLVIAANARLYPRAGRRYELKLHSQCLGRSLDFLQHAGVRAIAVGARMPEDRHARQLRHDLSSNCSRLATSSGPRRLSL